MISGAGTDRRWTFMAHLDATRSDVEPWMMKQLAELQTVPRDGLDVVAQVRRARPKPMLDKVQGAVETAIGAASVGVGVALPLGLGLALSPLAGAAALLATPVLTLVGAGWMLSGLSRHAVGARHRAVHGMQSAAWVGTRTLLPTASESHQRDRIDAPVLASSPSVQAPDPGALADTLIQDSRALPSQHLAYVAGGHTFAGRDIGDVRVSDIAYALFRTNEVRGRKTDVVVLAGCGTATLDSLAQLAPHARYAVVSQDFMHVTGLPWSQVLKRLSPLPDDPRTLVEGIVSLAGGRKSTPTLSAIDLERVPPLTRTVEDLGRVLEDAMGRGYRRDVRRAFREATHVPQTLGGLMGRINRTVGGVADLGDLLERLRQRCGDAAVQHAIADVQEALSQTVVSNAASPGLAASGINVRVPAVGFIFLPGTTMPQWCRLVERMRPWCMRHTAL